MQGTGQEKAIVNKTAPIEELIEAVKAALKGEPSGSIDWARAQLIKMIWNKK